MLPDGPFDVIVADPPWKFKNWSAEASEATRHDRRVERHYATHGLDWVCGLPVREIAAKDCHLFLWITGPLLAEGAHVKVMEAWGFKPSAVAFVWIKNKIGTASQSRMFADPISSADFVMGMGHTTRQNAEYVILGRRGSPKRQSRKTHQIIVAPRREHSRKPDQFYRQVEAYAGADKCRLDMFARERREGWVSFGNEADKFKGVTA